MPLRLVPLRLVPLRLVPLRFYFKYLGRKKGSFFAYPSSMENSKEHSVENNVGCK